MNIMKKRLWLLLVLLFAIGCSYGADSTTGNGYAGTPPGFYDDIDPNSLDDNDEDGEIPYYDSSDTVKKTNKNEQSSYQTFSENSSYSTYQDSVKSLKNYSEIYNNLEPAEHSYLHGIDPDEFYDEKDAAWSIYPLFRLNATIYFKNQAIQPGYYLLTPREHKGKWYILFKQNGKVVNIIPVYERGYTPEKFYDEHIPKPKLTKSQKIHMKILRTVGKKASSKRKEPVKSYLEVNDLDNYFLSIIVYYGGHKYSTLFRTIRL